MSIDKEKILEIIKQKGPLLPVQLSKEISQNVLISSAVLGELVSTGKIKFSRTKVGGSPLYYLEGQENRLQQLYTQLHDTEKKIYDLLKQKKVLRDKSLEPAFRVALRQIRDFATPLEINIGQDVELFWKWYLDSNEEIKPIIEGIIENEIKKKIEMEKPKIEKEKKEEVSKPIERPIPESELREKLRQELLKELKEELRKEILMQKSVVNVDKKEQERLEKEQKKKELDEKDIFLAKIRKYFQQKNIQISYYEIIKRKNEIDLTVNVPSAVGNIQYYCKAKNKRKINDNDISSAFLKGNQKKMPVLFLTTGDIIKKTQDKLSNEFKGISFKKINNN